MKGYIKLTAAGQDEVEAARASLLDDAEKKGHAAGVNIDCQLEGVSITDRLTLMSALGAALQFDKDDWAMLFMLKFGIGPLAEKQVSVDIPKNTAKGGI